MAGSNVVNIVEAVRCIECPLLAYCRRDSAEALNGIEFARQIASAPLRPFSLLIGFNANLTSFGPVWATVRPDCEASVRWRCHLSSP
jgi:hypothetical protein